MKRHLGGTFKLIPQLFDGLAPETGQLGVQHELHNVDNVLPEANFIKLFTAVMYECL
jgi:hypothetical protein